MRAMSPPGLRTCTCEYPAGRCHPLSRPNRTEPHRPLQAAHPAIQLCGSSAAVDQLCCHSCLQCRFTASQRLQGSTRMPTRVPHAKSTSHYRQTTLASGPAARPGTTQALHVDDAGGRLSAHAFRAAPPRANSFHMQLGSAINPAGPGHLTNAAQALVSRYNIGGHHAACAMHASERFTAHALRPSQVRSPPTLTAVWYTCSVEHCICRVLDLQCMSK